MDQKEKDIRKIINYINQMPSLSTTVAKILEICNDPNASPADLNRIISLDPVLMAKIMKLINSAYYGLPHEITSLARAIIMLGINTVKNLALSTAVLTRLKNKNQFSAIDMDGFWKHSLGVAVIAKYIAKRRKIDVNMIEEFFIAGLLHDIGKIPLNSIFSEKYLMAMTMSDRKNESLFLTERKVMPIDHTRVGLLILKTWKVGESITDAIIHHHEPEKYQGKNKEILYTVAIADYFANFLEIGFAGNRFPEKPNEEIFKHLDISFDILDEIEEVVTAEIEKATIFLNIS
ncbi:MAG: HDOD domain-containing protein [Spirochaetales bacterium]|nr:HDOD domain-containing protein [Spirochaetales bacterium]